jgi:hypothetical protein
MLFCKDVDLLYWEPALLKDATFASQVLAAGSGDIAGNQFTATTGPSFVTQAVETGQVLVLSGTIAGCYPITQVLGATQLRVSPLYAELFPEEGSPPASLIVGTASGLTYAVRTFWAQRKLVSDLLAQAIGIFPGTAEEADVSILNPEALKTPCVLGTLQMIYSAIAAAAADPAKFDVRAELYERLYRRSLRQARVDLDTDGDGVANVRRTPGVVALTRE